MPMIRRREFLGVSGAGFASLALPVPSGHIEWAFPSEDERPSLVVVYLRGGMDALNALVPYNEDRYYDLRPTLAIPPQDSAESAGVIRLDEKFGLHPALAALEPFWDAGRLAPIVNSGSPHATRSHFAAQDFMEYAAPGLRTIRDGWLNRYLTSSHRDDGSSRARLRALAMQGLLPRSLRGSFPVLAVPEKNVLRDDELLDLFGPLYVDPVARDEEMTARDEDRDSIATTGRDTFETLKHFREIVGSAGTHRARYPESRLGERLRNVAQVVRADEGLEIAALDVTGWDTHADQGGVEGKMADLLRNLAEGLAAFMNDLGPHLDRTIILVMTEFGRTCRENGNYGTDHGHGGLTLLMGGGVQGGRVHGRWSGLNEGNLYQERDLKVTTDFRDVFAEVLRQHFRFDVPKDFFPGHRAGKVRGLFE